MYLWRGTPAGCGGASSAPPIGAAGLCRSAATRLFTPRLRRAVWTRLLATRLWRRYDDRRARCEELWHRQGELRDRLQYMPPGDPDRERIEYRLHETHEDRERLGCEH